MDVLVFVCYFHYCYLLCETIFFITFSIVSIVISLHTTDTYSQLIFLIIIYHHGGTITLEEKKKRTTQHNTPLIHTTTKPHTTTWAINLAVPPSSPSATPRNAKTEERRHRKHKTTQNHVASNEPSHGRTRIERCRKNHCYPHDGTSPRAHHGGVPARLCVDCVGKVMLQQD